ncbi:protein LAP2-like [Sinocyclocheilus anshuiensis]|uniref:protein LAP2-like n=1 Tax=Sinocyclocheilus anshuiensis TaxID=1608454 RepID=UPI0007B9C008|nr:PREDICTED: protein LAP2-like [Sinocyclocheilus anshuiensis]
MLQRCRAAKTSVNNSSHGWPFPGLRWVTGKDPLSGLNLFPLTGGHGRSSSPEKDAEEMEEPSDDLGHFSELEGAGRRPKPQWGENGHDRKLQRYKTQRLVTHLHRDKAHDPECHTSSERLSHPAVSERPCSQKSVVSHVPLRLQIKVNGQRGGLGICIAGGKGSLPYKENDEGIFISRVSKGGPAEKAGVHVGDRVLEVNGQDMQEVSHHEAVGILRNAGSCIKMKVLRERYVPVEPWLHERSDTMETADPQVSQEWDVTMSNNRLSGPQSSTDPMLDCSPITNRMEATVCNGNGLNDLVQDLRLTKDMETFKNNALQVVKNTMTIPRIILTHPSTSDEDVEPLTQGPDDGDFDSDFSDSDSHIYSDCLNSAFYPL